MLREEQLRVERLEKERQKNLKDRLVVRVLEIDRTNGRAVLLQPRPAGDSLAGRRGTLHLPGEEARDPGRDREGRVLPDPLSAPATVRSRPTPRSIQIRQWFKDVPHGVDVP